MKFHVCACHHPLVSRPKPSADSPGVFQSPASQASAFGFPSPSFASSSSPFSPSVRSVSYYTSGGSCSSFDEVHEAVGVGGLRGESSALATSGLRWWNDGMGLHYMRWDRRNLLSTRKTFPYERSLLVEGVLGYPKRSLRYVHTQFICVPSSFK